MEITYVDRAPDNYTYSIRLVVDMLEYDSPKEVWTVIREDYELTPATVMDRAERYVRAKSQTWNPGSAGTITTIIHIEIVSVQIVRREAGVNEGR